MPQEIYCDESGFTGNDLSNKESPFFAFATVATTHPEASQFVASIIKDFNVQAGELKFTNLKRYSRGRKAITKIISEYASHAKICVHEKKYNLACKFFEYSFEPVLAKKSSIFYQLNFNRFISELLYTCFKASTQYSEEIFSEFDSFMRSKNIDDSNYIFRNLKYNDMHPVLEMIIEFCYLNRDVICTELDSLKDCTSGKWILDLSTTSLISLLSEWSQEFSELSVYCDQSKPLIDSTEFLNSFVGSEHVMLTEYRKEKFYFGCNLNKEILFVDSKLYPGIQLADILAGVANLIFTDKRVGQLQDECSEWIDLLINSFSGSSVISSFENIDLNDDLTKLNFLILEELNERSRSKKPILENIEYFIIDTAINLKMNDIDKISAICHSSFDFHTQAACFVYQCNQSKYL
jgi:hypothetical protein